VFGEASVSWQPLDITLAVKFLIGYAFKDRDLKKNMNKKSSKWHSNRLVNPKSLFQMAHFTNNGPSHKLQFQK
jgi:hypothetical protein